MLNIYLTKYENISINITGNNIANVKAIDINAPVIPLPTSDLKNIFMASPPFIMS
jgi:hypothetical protein